MAGESIVRIAQVSETVFAVTILPPVPFLPAASTFPSYSAAVGYACGYSIALQRPIRDDARGLAPEKLKELCDRMVVEGIEIALQRLARGEPIFQ